MPEEVVPMPPVVFLVNVLVTLLIFVLVLRTVLANVTVFVSRNRLGPVFGSIHDYVIDVTEPLLAPIRRILPDTGVAFDFSPLVAIIAIDLIGRLLTYALLRVM